MLRVGLTGNLGSGKSTVAAMLAQRGALVLSSDEIGRTLMEPGTVVFDGIVRLFGPTAVTADGRLDRTMLARRIFAEEHSATADDGEESGPDRKQPGSDRSGSRGARDTSANPLLEAMNAIVHPAVIAEQERLSAVDAEGKSPHAIVVVESALLFETAHAGPEGWRSRFDLTVLVTAPEPVRLARAVEREMARRGAGAVGEISGGVAALQARVEADLRLRLAHQMPEQEKAALADFVLANDGDRAELERQTDALWDRLLERRTRA
jgi:dephospho-CoA kinase